MKRHGLLLRLAISLIGCTLALGVARAQDSSTPPDNIEIQPTPAPDPHRNLSDSSAELGEIYDLFTGSLAFRQVDLSLPGNGFPIEISRIYRVSDFKYRVPISSRNGPIQVYEPREFGDWELEVPSVSVVMPDGAFPNSVCSGGLPDAPNIPYNTVSNPIGKPVQVQTVTQYGPGYSTGYYLEIPKLEPQLIYARDASFPGTAPFVTQQNWQLSCISGAKDSSGNNVGEGFLVTSPQGVQYTLNRLVKRAGFPLRELLGTINAMQYKMSASHVVDVDGNSLDYYYNTAGRVSQITASDGRIVALDYNPDNTVSVMSAGGRAWSYGYASMAYNEKTLTQVLRPDNSKWQIALSSFALAYPSPLHGDWSSTGSITTPYGMTATYTIRTVDHWPRCGYVGLLGLGISVPDHTTTYALTSKLYQGASVGPYTWNYDYSSYQQQNQTTTINRPDGTKERHQLYVNNCDNQDRLGQVLSSEVLDANGQVLQNVENTYGQNRTLGFAPDTLRTYYNGRSNTASKAVEPELTQSQITQDGSVYTTNYSGYDAFAYYTQAQESNNFNGSRAVVEQYQHNQNQWIIGLKTGESYNGTQASSATYDNFGHKIDTYQYGLLESTSGYDAQGNLASTKDPLGHITELKSYYRGAPQTVQRPDNSTIAQTLDAFGEQMSYSDARGNTTSYSRDGMGRLTGIVYPQNDTQNWSSPGIQYIQLTQAELNIPAGAWKSVYSDGHLRRTTYYDGLLRPTLVEEKDLSLNTARYFQNSYDYAGRLIFQSFPSSDPPGLFRLGHQFTYDALGRVVQKATVVLSGPPRNRPIPVVEQTTTYLSGNRTQVTDAENNVTTNTYQAFGRPDTTSIIETDAPGQTTTISRDVFGHMLSATQSGNGVNSTRSYIYDANYRPCKIVDPESAQSVTHYDAASRIDWQANGQNGSASTCDYNSVPASAQIQYTYDLLDRKNGIAYPDSTGNITFGYDLDGHLTGASNPTASWTYTYDKRGLVENERMASDAYNWNFVSQYDPQAHMSQRNYPDGTIITYAPDAWGEPTQLGSFASNILYWANGSPQSYTLGNGVAVSTQLDQHQRLQNQTVTAGNTALQNLSYAYNNDNDLTDITDNVNGVDTASLGYDGLHRLTSASGMWGAYIYSYDALNNIAGRSGPNALTYSYDRTSNRLGGISGGVTRNYGYDAEGRVIGDGVRNYIWNAADQITGAGTSGYAYDANGERVRSITAQATVFDLYDLSGQLVARGDVTHGIWTDFVDLHGQPVAQKTGTTVTYLHADLLGSPRLSTDASAKVLWQEHYDPYGFKLNAVNEQRGYTGHVYDAETGLTYAKARFYDAQVGRFLSTDPSGFSTKTTASSAFNLYAYTKNNPYRYVDPSGASPLDLIYFAKDVGGLLIDEGIYAAAKINGNQAVADMAIDAMVEDRFDAAASTLGMISPVPGTGKAVEGMQEAKAVGELAKGNTLYHYTDAAGAKGITESGKILPDAKGRVYLTNEKLSPSETNNALFMGRGGEKGTYRVDVNMREGTQLRQGEQPNELIHQGTIRDGRQADIEVKTNDFN